MKETIIVKQINVQTGQMEESEEIIEINEEEIAKQELQSKNNEANHYLKDTDWVNNYKTRHDLGLELIPEYSSKWKIIQQRDEYIAFLKDNQ